MRRKNLSTKVSIIAAIFIAPVILFLLYAHGPIPLIRLIPYDTEVKKTAFPQWIGNDEICYIEFIFRMDEKAFERVVNGGMPIFLVRQPLTDIDIYREKINQPETKRLIRRISRKYVIAENLSDTDWGFRVYDNGRKIFLYYRRYSGMLKDYRYITMDITGRNPKERVPKIFPFDISQDGSKLYGIFVESEPSLFAQSLLGVKRNPEPKRRIAECPVRGGRIKELMDFSDENFQRTFRGSIKNLKLLADDKMVLTYTNDVNKSPYLEYTYLIDIPSGRAEFVEDPEKVFGENDARFDIFGDSLKILTPDRTYAMTKDKRYLISGNNCIYERDGDKWVKIKDFFKTNPIISPDGEKILYYDILTEKGLADYSPNYIRYLGEKLAVSDIKTIFEEEK